MSEFSGLEIAFVVCAVIGGFVVVVRMILQAVGIDHDVDTDFDADHGDLGHPDTISSFHILSLQSVAAFVLMFGAAGLAMSRATEASDLITIVVAVHAGLGGALLVAYLFALTLKLQSSGTFDISKTVGCEGTVYLTIPTSGTGLVTVNMRNRLMELDAQSADAREIKTGENVEVVGINGKVLVVRPMAPHPESTGQQE